MVTAQEQLLLPETGVCPGKTCLIFLVIKGDIPTLGHDGIVNGLGFDRSALLVHRDQRKSMAAAKMLDFYRPTCQFHTLPATGIGVFEQAFRPEILNLVPSDRPGFANFFAWTLRGHQL